MSSNIDLVGGFIDPLDLVMIHINRFRALCMLPYLMVLSRRRQPTNVPSRIIASRPCGNILPRDDTDDEMDADIHDPQELVLDQGMHLFHGSPIPPHVVFPRIAQLHQESHL
jgi:hypothetical protein